MSESNYDWADRLRALSPNWDDEGAPVPSEIAINKAKDIFDWVNQHGLTVESVDADVLGGVAIYLDEVNDKSTWIAIRNDGATSIIIRHDNKINGYDLNDFSLESLKKFLVSEGN